MANLPSPARSALPDRWWKMSGAGPGCRGSEEHPRVKTKPHDGPAELRNLPGNGGSKG